MKKIYSLLFLVLLFVAKNSDAQMFSTSCSSPHPINSTTSYTFPAITGIFNTDTTNDYGCIAPANNAAWYYLQACTAGSLSIIFSSTMSSASDVDFIVWGPLSSPTDCGLSSSQIADCSSASGMMDTLNIPSVTVGGYYKILVSNPSNAIGTYTFGASGSAVFDSICTSCTGNSTQEICQVTTDPVVNHNIIIWNKDTSYTGSYYIQKETTTMGVYATIATVTNSDTSAYEDTGSNPMIQSFMYRIKTVDTCGHTFYGGPHQTIHLLTSISSSTGYPQLAWNPYVGFSYGTYYIFRGSSPSSLVLYDSISASFNSYTDVAAVSGLNYYSVSVTPPGPCHPSRSLMTEYSFSNISSATFTGIIEHELANLSVGPNPANEALNFSLGTVSPSLKVDVIDVTGRLIISKTYKNVMQDQIGLSEISNGSYIVRFTTENGTTHKNIIVAR